MNRLKWIVASASNGAWGDEPNGIDDVVCVRVADFDREQFKVIECPPTKRSIPAVEKRKLKLEPGDLLIEKSGGGDNQLVGCVVEFTGRYEAVSSNFICRLRLVNRQDPRYWAYQFAALYSSRQNLRSIKQTTGIQNLDLEAYLNERVSFPPFEKQQALAAYLDRETANVDRIVGAKERLLELITEKRRALITHAVTRGLDPNVPLRESGVPWLGEIPTHWETERTHWLFRERDERSTAGEEELLTVSHLTGVTPRSEKNVNMFEADSTEGYKRCDSGDLVINTLWAWMGAMGVARVPGIVSPAYNVYVPSEKLDPEYVDALVRVEVFAQEVTRYSKGVWSSRLRLYPEGFFEVVLPVPPLVEQTSIVAHIRAESEKLETLRAAAHRTIALLKERRSALIAAAVTGQLNIPEAA